MYNAERVCEKTVDALAELAKDRGVFDKMRDLVVGFSPRDSLKRD